MLNGHFQEQPPNSLSPLLPPVPSAVASGNGEKIPGGLLSDMEPELNYVPRYPKLLKPEQKETPPALRPSGLNPYYISIKMITF